MATGGSVLVGMLPAVLVTEAGEKDEAACWEAGAANLTEVWLLAPGTTGRVCEDTGRGSKSKETRQLCAQPVLHSASLSCCTPKRLKEQRSLHHLCLGLRSSCPAW